MTNHTLPNMRHCVLCLIPESRTVIGGKIYSNMYDKTEFCKDCFSSFINAETDKRKGKK